MIKRCILISPGLEMLFVSLMLSYSKACIRGDVDGTPVPFKWGIFGKNMLIASPVIAIGVGLIQLLLITVLFLLPWIALGTYLHFFAR